MQWPDYFPDDCPPQDAQPATGDVYRLVKTESTRIKRLYPHSAKSNLVKILVRDECKVCGLSVFRRFEDAVEMKNRERGMKNRLIAKGTLSPDLGKIKHTPSSKPYGQSHHTWWVPTEVEPWSVFHVVQIPQEG